MTTLAEIQKIFASDGAAGDAFGFSAAISGDLAIVGASLDDIGANIDQGSAYIFVKVGCTWQFEQKLTASDGATGDRFGWSVSVSGDIAVVGAPLDDVGVNTDQGSAYVFVRSGTIWMEQAKLSASDGATDDRFGWSVSVSGDTAVVGSYLDNIGANTDQGSAYVFTRSGTIWMQEQKLTSSDGGPYDYFGNSVAINGDTAIIGALNNDNRGPYAGSAYVFVRNGAVWIEQQELTALDTTNYDLFGQAVAIEGDTVVVGASLADVGGHADQGAAYIFTRIGTVWIQKQKITASDGTAGDFFGTTLGISGNTIVVGADLRATASGSAYIFEQNSDSNWTQTAILHPSDYTINSNFGNNIAINNGWIIVGSFSKDDLGVDSGAAYIFERCTPKSVYIDPDPTMVFVGQNTTITASPSTGTDKSWTFMWHKGTEPIGTGGSTLTINEATLGDAGTYSVIATDENGCSLSLASFILTVNPLPIISGPTSALFETQSFELTATSDFSSYAWYKIEQNGTQVEESSVGAGSSFIKTKARTTDSGNYVVEVSDANGNVARSEPFWIVVLPVTISGPKILLPGRPVVLKAINLPGTGPFTFVWYKGTQLFESTNQSIKVEEPGDFTVVLMEGTDVISTSPIAHVIAMPSITIPGTDGTQSPYRWAVVASQDGIKLNAPELPPGYTYSFAQQKSSGGSLAVTESGEYSLSVTDSEGNRTELDPVNVIVFSVSINATRKVLIQGESVELHANLDYRMYPLSLGANLDYRWHRGTEQVGSGPSYIATESGDYTVSILDENGNTATSDPFSLEVLPFVIGAFGPTAILQGDSVTLAAPDLIGVTYDWYRGTEKMGTTTVAIGTDTQEKSGYTFSLTQSGTYSAVITHEGGSNAISNAVDVIVAPLTITPSGPTNFLIGGSVGLTVPEIDVSYHWYYGTTEVGSGLSYTASQEGTYTVVAKRQTHIFTPVGSGTVIEETLLEQTSIIATASIDIIFIIPTITAQGPTTFLEGGTVVLESDVSGTQFLYAWFNNGVYVGQDATFMAQQSGNYNLVISDAQGSRVTSNYITVTVVSVQITAWGDTTFFEGGNVFLTATELPGTQFSYAWYNGTQFLSSDQTYLATESGSYCVMVNDGEGHSITSNIITVNAVIGLPRPKPPFFR